MDVRSAFWFLHFPRFFPSSLSLIILVNTLFFSGYIILKDPLAYILFSQGMPLDQAYSMTTTANLLLSFFALFFGFFMQGCMDQKHALLLSIALCNVSLILFNQGNSHLILLAMSAYVVGGGLYFFNILIFINRLCQDAPARIRGNYYYRIFTNVGAMLGLGVLISQIQTHHVFAWSLSLSLSAFIVMLLSYPWIAKDKSSFSWKTYFQFYVYLLILFSLTYVAFGFQNDTRWIVMGVFILGLTYAIGRAIYQKHIRLLSLISLIVLLNLPYWLASTVFLNGFFYFLKQDVSPVFGNVASTYLSLIDPFMNVVIGVGMLAFQKKEGGDFYKNIVWGSFALVFAFSILILGIYSGQGLARIHFIYPLLALMGFALAEFLIQTHLNARIRQQLAQDPRAEFYATGIMRSTRAFASAIAFYLMAHASLHHQNLQQDKQAYLSLFLSLLLICSLSSLGLIKFKNFFINDERVV